MRLSESSAQDLLARLLWRFVLLGLAVITIAFAGVYYVLTINSPADAIRDTTSHRITFWTCLYFSVVTESTLGDGNISPLGRARVVVGLQVLLGLATAGIIVAKITSARSMTLARLTARTEGDWVDCVRSPNGNIAVGRTWIEGAHNGLVFQGTDFHGDGTRAGSFLSHSLSVSNDKASFGFQSFDFTSKLFSGGVQTLRFSKLVKGRYMEYMVSIYDPSGQVFVGYGKRLESLPFQKGLTDRESYKQADISAIREFFLPEFP